MNDQKLTTESYTDKATFVIPTRLVSLIIALIMVLLCVVFLVGYFWGKKKALEAFCRSTERTSLADHIYVALCGVSESSRETSNAPVELDEVVEEQESYVATQDTESSETEKSSENSPAPAIAQTENKAPEELQATDNIEAEDAHYHAELIGFGTMQGAKRFAARLEKKGIPVIINKRVSKTAKGRAITWYQVVTTSYKNKDSLIALVNTLKQQERLNDVRIIANNSVRIV